MSINLKDYTFRNCAMKKLNIIFILILALFSCKKENNLPPEYEYLIGDWILDSYTIDNNPGAPYSTVYDLPASAIGKKLSIKINKYSIQYFIEETLTQNISNISGIEVDTRTYSGTEYIFYYVKYRDELYAKKAAPISYIPAENIIRISYRLYDSDNGIYVGGRYSFNFKRN